jgi:AcrR family transcriptional regulator
VRESSATRIRHSATSLFAEHGFAATSVRDIARGCGLSPGAIYNHFESKDAILNAIAVDNHQELFDALSSAASNGHGSAADRLDALVDALTLHCVEASVAMDVSEREWAHLSEPHRTRVVELRRATLALFESALLTGVESGEFELPSGGRPSAALIAKSIVNMLVLNAEWYRPEGPLAPAQITDIHRELVRRMTRPAQIGSPAAR